MTKEEMVALIEEMLLNPTAWETFWAHAQDQQKLPEGMSPREVFAKERARNIAAVLMSELGPDKEEGK